jgi:hypothetical protein
VSAKAKILVVHGGSEGSYEYHEPLGGVVRGQLDNPAEIAHPS